MSVGLQRLREDASRIRQGALDKGEDPTLVDEAISADEARRRLLGEGDALRNERKQLSERIGTSIKGGSDPKGSEVVELRARSTELGARIASIEGESSATQARLDDLLLRIPNPADADVPVGGEGASVIVRSWGEPAARDGRKPHWEVAEANGLFDLAAGAKVAGSGFPIYRGDGAALQRALIDFMLELHTKEHGFTEIWPPAVINADSARGTGQIPDKEDQMYVVTRDDLYLVPTAEVPVTNIHRDEIIEADRMPIRYVAYSPCFRREAGAAGAKTRGILRVHQFDKVEMVCFEKPEASNETLEWLTARAEIVLQKLGLPYRVKLMATGNMGFVQAKKYDLEVWAPGVEDWLEVSSVSNFRDYQARRMNIRWRPQAAGKAEILHTLNGSGLALARTVAAI
ncbi:MAG: serine--tRNA ligase, partial [Chloroflexota bacterium]|nr:serine--tRNA ligase [Chloroflexota bacterium]